ncbi:hypothetical protein ACQCSX_13760 [Pseudarthrobacter sp. P1]|uniref:hypothetical protein n=1 Tax=Pseudarthrobacter sp. P1 TaxID=3418418 RepID=UPI003CF97A98
MKRSILVLPALGMAAAVALSACAPGAASSGTSTPVQSAVSTSVPAGNVTLELATTPESGAATKQIAEAFAVKNPNVSVNVTATNFSDYNAGLNRQLDADKAPDIALINMVGNTVKNKLIANLDS